MKHRANSATRTGFSLPGMTWGLFPFLVAFGVALAVLGTALTARAELDTVIGTTNPVNGFPFWYQDKGVPRQTLELCWDPNDGLCVTSTPVPNNNFSQQIGFGAEAFYWFGGAEMTIPVGGALAQAGMAQLIMGLEASFGNPTGEPVSGQQITFGRLRIRIDAPVAGTYTITHPFGVETFTVSVPGIKAINSGVGAAYVAPKTGLIGDIGCLGAPCDFTLAASSGIGPFLKWDPAVLPAAPPGYLGNPAILHKVTGSPAGNNFFRVQGPPGANLDGQGNDTITTDLFTVSGKVFSNTFSSTPVSKNFGKLLGGTTSAVQTFTVKNVGIGSLTITGSTLGGANADNFTKQADTCATAGAVAANGTCTIDVVFSPAAGASGAKSASITITSTETAGGLTAPSLTIELSGTADSTPPAVALTIPANAATGAAVNGAITATFNEAMDATTIVGANFTLSGPSGAVAGTVTFDAANNTATFTPSASLDFGAQYTATITTGVKDAVGLAMVANKTWTFTTSAAPDTTRPTVASTSPQEGATNIAADKVVTVTFSEPMDSSLISTTTFLLSNLSTGAVTGVVSYDPTTNTASFTPSAGLASNSTYRAIITNGVKDLAGNAMLTNFTLNFKAIDTVSPQVILTTPLNAAVSVALDANVTVEFSEAMDPATITTSTLTLNSASGSVAGTVSYNAGTNIATFSPSGNLSPNTTYTATVTTGAKDTSGHPVISNVKVTFTTLDTTAPTVVAVSPSSGLSGAGVSSTAKATFSEDMDVLTITDATFTLSSAAGQVQGVVTYDEVTKTATLITFEDLSFNTAYTAIVTADVKDLAGNPLAANKVWTFTTETPAALTVIKAGSGSGTVTGSVDGINCGSACTSAYSVGTQVTLSAVADDSSHFSGWAGGGCTGESDCTVTLNKDTTVTALFGFIDPSLVTLKVVKSGNGSGTVTVTATAHSLCGTDCYVYKLDATGSKKVNLIAKPDPGVKFIGWSGDYEGASVSMPLTLLSDALIVASFGEPNILVSEKDLDFGNVVKKQSKTLPLIITNDGDIALRIKSLKMTGKGAALFRVLNALSGKAVKKANIEPGGSLQLDVKFRPTGKGLKAVKLNINSDDPHTPVEVVHLNGMGAAPAQAKGLSLSDEDYLTVVEMEELIAREPTVGAQALGNQSSQLSADALATREYMAVLIITALEGEPDADYCATGSPYADVYPDSPACKYIKRLYELAGEASEDVFYPEAPVTREQLSEMLREILEK